MSERQKIVRTVGLGLALAIGAGSLAGCGEHHEGAGEVPILDCKNGPKSNKLTIGSFPKGKSLIIGDSLYYDTHGVGEGAKVSSLGAGKFSVERGNTTVVSGDSPSLEQTGEMNPKQEVTVAGNEITFIDGHEQFSVSAEHTEGSSQTSLTIQATCVN